MSSVKILLQFFLAIVVVISLGFIAVCMQRTDEANEPIEELKEIAGIKEVPGVPKESYSDKEGEREASSPFVFEDPYLEKLFNFEALKEKNKDIIGWIVVPGTNIDYPILKAGDGKEDRYYLRRTYEGVKNSHGSIFVEKKTDSALKDDISLIYGHNMKDGTMFAGLHRYLDMNYLRGNNHVYIYIPGQAIKYEIFACMERDDSYITDDYPDVEKLLTYVSKEARNFVTEVDISKGRILALSTCGASGRRILVFAVEQKRLDFLDI